MIPLKSMLLLVFEGCFWQLQILLSLYFEFAQDCLMMMQLDTHLHTLPWIFLEHMSSCNSNHNPLPYMTILQQYNVLLFSNPQEYFEVMDLCLTLRASPICNMTLNHVLMLCSVLYHRHNLFFQNFH